MSARRPVVVAATLVVVLALGAGPALACGGLVSPNGTIPLVRTTTMAAYHNGLEHYVTSFEFAGGGAEFGSIIPLPANPRQIVHGGYRNRRRVVAERSVQDRAHEREVGDIAQVHGDFQQRAQVGVERFQNDFQLLDNALRLCGRRELLARADFESTDRAGCALRCVRIKVRYG